MMRLFALAVLTLAGCSDVPGQVHGKLLCLQETREAYTASKNLGDTVFLRRVEYADVLCKESK